MCECARCHVDYYHNAEVRVFYSAVCDHRVCERCISRLFRDKTCPGCGKNVRAEDFSEHPPVAKEVESEVKVRRQISEIYCKTEQDFASSDDWNEYLMMREDIIYKLINPTFQDDVQETRRQIEKYREQNAEQILRAQRLLPKKKMQKIASIIQEEGAFASQVNADWKDGSTREAFSHPFEEQYRDLLLQLPALSPREARPLSAEQVSPLVAPQPLAGDFGVKTKERQMSGGGQVAGSCLKKARHFFFLDLKVATGTFVTSCA